jgi:membrane-bound serine protease (ClpP class)
VNIDFSTIDPNIIYLALVYGLWTGVTAVYVPGTGLLETKAFIALAISIGILSQLSTNWIAVIMIVIGVSAFIVVPFLRREYANMALAGLALQGLGGLVLFDDQTVSPFIIALTMLAPFAYFHFVLIPMLDRLQQEKIIEKDDLLVGQRGKVMKALDPVGTINVNSESWTAVSDEPLEAGTEVIVVERNGLQLTVEAVKHKRQSHLDNNLEEATT